MASPGIVEGGLPWGSWPLTPSPIYPPIHSTMLWLKAQMFDGVEVPFKRMLSLYTREMLYLPTQIIAQRNSTGRALNYLSRGYLQVRCSTYTTSHAVTYR